jgi:hypothetical protein
MYFLRKKTLLRMKAAKVKSLSLSLSLPLFT